jgi:hypothetical protein
MRCAAAAFHFCLILSALTATAEDKFTPLFNGKDLEGWHGDPELWKVADGAIVGSSDNKQLQHNSFLATKKIYKNFVLKAKFKLRNHNSGIQYRSNQGDDFVVTGYQADIADNAFMGILYEEGGRGILANVDGAEVLKHVNKDGWNEYVITADGPHLTQVLNGFTTVDYTEKSDKGATQGVIAFQLHAGPAMQIEFKDVEIAERP